MMVEEASITDRLPQTKFMGKTWIFTALAIIFGLLGLFSLIMGPLFLFEVVWDANNKPAPTAGWALTIISVPFIGLFALAVSNILARRAPLIQIFREGMSAREIGRSSLGQFIFVPAFIHVAWTIVSGQGFRQRTFAIPWESVYEARASRSLTSDRLTLVGSAYGLARRGNSSAVVVAEALVYGEDELRTPLDEIASAINYYCQKPDARKLLLSWSEQIENVSYEAQH